MTQSDDDRDPRVYMAAERTFLAWIRTGIALMVFGFVVARFAVLMVEFGLIARDEASAAGSTRTASHWVGVALVASGILTCLASAVRHDRYIRAIDEGRFRSAFGSTLARVIVAMLVTVGVVMMINLLRL